VNEEPRSKLEASMLAGIFVGEEIYYTLSCGPVSGFLVHTRMQSSSTTFPIAANFPEQDIATYYNHIRMYTVLDYVIHNVFNSKYSA
jgi:hypothetical protein